MTRHLAILVALALPLAGCSPSHAATRGYGVTSFARIRVSGPMTVHVRVGGSPSVRATGEQDALDRLSVEQNDDVLVIKPLPGGWGGWPGGVHGPVVVEVQAPALDQVSVTGSGTVTVDRVKGDRLDLALSGSGDLSVGPVDVDRLSAVMTGSGDLSVAGRARAATALLTGPGDLRAGDLQANEATARLVGSGDLTVGARDSAKVDLAGAGDITVAGPGVCTITRTGSGDVHCQKVSRD